MRPDDPITRHLRTDVARLYAGQTVGQALDWLRKNPPGGRILYFYVVDTEGRLVGVVPTRRLVLNNPDVPIDDIMVRRVITVPADATVLDACEFFIQHRLLALPVVDDNKVLLGQVDVELYTDEMAALSAAERPARPDDLFALIGVHLSAARPVSAVAAFRTRFPWLLCNLGGGLLAAFLSGLYDDVVAIVAVSLFIPVVLAMAESVAIQSVSLAVEAFGGGRVTWRVVLPRLRRELLTGGMIGLSAGVLIGAVALIWLRRPDVAVSLWGGIAGGATVAAGVGLAVPAVLRLLKRDPQVAAGPIALVTADMLTLLVYYNLARGLVAG